MSYIPVSDVPPIPASHANTHKQGGADSIKLDDLAVPDDNADLNASVDRHGLLIKLNGDSATFLAGDGTWRLPIG